MVQQVIIKKVETIVNSFIFLKVGRTRWSDPTGLCRTCRFRVNLKTNTGAVTAIKVTRQGTRKVLFLQCLVRQGKC